jgi:hypothetical protein
MSMWVGKRNCFAVFLFVTLLWSCGPRYNFFNGEFRYQPYTGEVVYVTGEPTGFDILGATGLWIEDSILVAQFLSGSEVLLSAYSLHTQQLLCKNLMLKGNGPNEYLWTDFLSSYTDPTGSKLWVSADRKMVCIDLAESISKEKLVVFKDVDLRQFENNYSIIQSFAASDTSLVLLSIINNMEVLIGDLRTGQSVFYDWMFSEDISSQNRMTFLSSSLFYHTQKRILAGGMVFFNQVNFLSLPPDINKFSVSTESRPIRYQRLQEHYADFNEMSYYYTRGCCTDEYLICKYAGGKNRYEQEREGGHDFLHIFNWEGDLLKIIALDRRLLAIAFDSRSHTLYGIDAENEIVCYRLSV